MYCSKRSRAPWKAFSVGPQLCIPLSAFRAWPFISCAKSDFQPTEHTTVLTPLSSPRCGNKPFLGDALLHYQPRLGTPLLTCQELQAKLPEANLPSHKNRSGFCTESPIFRGFRRNVIFLAKDRIYMINLIFFQPSRPSLSSVKTTKIEVILLFCDSFVMQEIAMRNDRFRPSEWLGWCGPPLVRPEVCILYASF
jgi:hypothetical protein